MGPDLPPHHYRWLSLSAFMSWQLTSGAGHVPKILVTLIPTIILIQKDAVPARDSVQLPNPERLHDDVTRPRPASGRLFGSGDGWLRLTTVPTVGVEESGDGCHRVKGSVTV